eukprot:COSAG03_NODE_8108_length_836_cov_1.565807_1_plen_135_part_10
MGGRLAFWGLAMVGVGAQDNGIYQMETNALTTVCPSFSLTSLSLSLALSLSLSLSLSLTPVSLSLSLSLSVCVCVCPLQGFNQISTSKAGYMTYQLTVTLAQNSRNIYGTSSLSLSLALPLARSLSLSPLSPSLS